MRRIYVAGPMSGLPEFNYPAFHEAEAALRAIGYHVENPARNEPPPCGTWEGWLRLAIAQVVTCDEIALLPGWEQSKGATLEFHIARQLSMPARPLADVLSGPHA